MVFRLRAAAIAVALALAAVQPSAAQETVRVGVLKFGTVSWELDAMTRNGLDVKHGIRIEVTPYAGEDATAVALQGGAVEMIVSDWLWVSRMRAEGSPYVFAPYSTAVGSIMVPKDSPIRALGDLKGRRLGVAGGPLDKNWLLIQALATREARIDLAEEAEIAYGAPPLLAEKAKQGELDAVLIFWNYAARLEAAGFRELVSGEEATGAAGAAGPVAAIGYVFPEAWAKANPGAVEGFLAASRETKELLRTSDAEWTALIPLVKPEDGVTLAVMRDRYRRGIPMRPVAEEEKDAAALYRVLRDIGGETLVGPGRTLDPGTYWVGPKNAS